MDNSVQFNFNNQTYYLSSHQAKLNVINLQKRMYVMLICDFISNVFYGIHYHPLLYLLPLFGWGIFGIWKYHYKILTLFQLYMMVNICLKVYIITIVELIYQKIFYGIFIPYDFYLLYKCWLYIWEIKVLNSYDRKKLRQGWSGN